MKVKEVKKMSNVELIMVLTRLRWKTTKQADKDVAYIAQELEARGILKAEELIKAINP